MEQPKNLKEMVPQALRQISSSSQTPTTSLTRQEQEKTLMITSKFGDRDSFLVKVTPDTQASFARKPEKAIMGDYPTLTDICLAYGKTFSEQWLYPQIADLSTFTGAKNLTKEQIQKLASVIAIEYRHLKVTELLLFFHLFKTGRYGRFYGTVDPMVITCALRDFMKERNVFIGQYEQLERERKAAEEAKIPTMTHEEYLKLKQQEENEQKDKEQHAQ